MGNRNGYEYQEVARKCPRSGKHFLAPIAWSSKKVVRPEYPTCTCCKTQG